MAFSTSHERSSLGDLVTLPIVPALEFADWDPRGISIARERAVRQVTSPTAEPTSADKKFVQAVIANPGTKSSDFARLIGMGQRRAAQIRRGLVERGLLREHQIATSATGRSAIVLEVLPEAYHVLGIEQTTRGGT